VSSLSTARIATSGSTPSTPVATDDPGSTLMREAVDLIERRQWRNALTVLESTRHLRPDDPAIDELTAIAAAHGRRRRVLAEALARIEARDTASVSALHAQAVVALARRRYLDADGYARRAIEVDPSAAAGWVDLATAFAGLGWFDQAADCLAVAEGKGGMAPAQEWRLGQAVNQWGLSRTPALAVTVLAFVLVNILSVAVGLSTPILLREVRVNRLDEPFRSAAHMHWRSEHRLKLAYGLGVLASVVLYIVAVALVPS
jgi:tetratricopeptide (TPR) repeat protein